MTAEYKIRTQLTENDRALAHITIRVEKHMFIDKRKMEVLRRAADGVTGIEEMLEASESVLKLLGLERPETMLLGLESDWKPISEKAAEQVVDKFYQAEPSFSASLQGGARDGSLLIQAGNASMSIPLNKDQAQRDKDQLERLRQYCVDHPPEHKGDVQRAVEAIKQAGTVSSATYTAGVVCLEGVAEGAAEGAIGGPEGTVFGAALGCIGKVALALGTFIKMVEHYEKEMKDEQDMRDRERACSSNDGLDYSMVERVNSTC